MAPAPLTLLAATDASSTLKIQKVAELAHVAITVSAGGGQTPCGLPAPELKVGDDLTVRHTNAIIRRLAQTTECGLMGSSFMEESQVDSWLEWCTLVVDHHIVDQAAPLETVLDPLEAQLKSRTFLVGQRLTVADISLSISLKATLEKKGIDGIKTKHPHAVRWFMTCVHQLGLQSASAGQKGQKGKQEQPKKDQAAPKAAAAKSPKQAPAASPAAGGNVDAEVTAVGDKIRILKEKLKGEGLSGKKVNDHEEVKALVARLVELKSQQASAPPAAAASPAKPAQNSPAQKAAASPKASPKQDAAAAPAGEGGGKNAEKKAKKDAEKKAKEDAKAAREAEQKAASDAKFKGPDVTLETIDKHTFGNLFIRSECLTKRTWTTVKELGASLKGKKVWVRARVQTLRKQGNKLCFLTLRHSLATVQAVAFGQEIAGFAGALSDESVVDIYGEVSCPDESINSCTQQDVEVQVEKVFCIGRAQALPITVADAGRSELEYEKDPTLVKVGQDTRLDARIIDLRTHSSQAIFRIQSGVCRLFREYLASHSFTEIHTPKLLGGCSEGGADVFKVDYFDTHAYLAQSPQLFKQMVLMADMERVFEIAPVFRSEKSFTHRHMTEFMGLDMEMTFKDHYHEVLDMIDGTFNHIFNGLNQQFKPEIEAVRAQYPFKDLQWKHPCKRFTFEQAVLELKKGAPKVLEARLKKAATDYERGIIERHLEAVKGKDIMDDISTEDEKVLGEIVHNKYGEDYYLIDKFPADLRPFYSMRDPNDPRWANAYDFFLRGEEITSGAQRIHDPKMLVDEAEKKGVGALHQPYVDAFKYGAFPHAGAGIGLERVVMLFLQLNNIRKTSLFPRDPKRLTP